jgi:predicted Rossmann fold flavoprotein
VTEQLPISWELDCEVSKIVPEEWGFLISAKDDRQFRCGQVVVACGGVGYPEIGNGQGIWDLMVALGHMVSEPVPAMVPLLTQETWPADCRADTLPRVELVIPGGRKRSWTGDLIFTEKGIAGPVVMDASGEIAAVLKQVGNVAIRLRLRGGWSPEDWRRHLEKATSTQGRTPVGEWLSKETNPSLAVVAANAAAIAPDTRLGELSRKTRNAISDWLGGISLTVTGTAGFERAMVTRGGVTPREVKADSLESIIIPGLYLAGEVLDIDGPCGGFNLQWAFASGHRVGRKLA